MYNSNKVSDLIIAQKSKHIDLIIGGHTHSFLEKPILETNLDGKKVIINQVGWGGINIGKIDFIFKQNKTNFDVKNSSIFCQKKLKSMLIL